MAIENHYSTENDRRQLVAQRRKLPAVAIGDSR
jgi:hypothetical protein